MRRIWDTIFFLHVLACILYFILKVEFYFMLNAERKEKNYINIKKEIVSEKNFFFILQK